MLLVASEGLERKPTKKPKKSKTKPNKIEIQFLSSTENFRRI
jgi:hypothetical protein